MCSTKKLMAMVPAAVLAAFMGTPEKATAADLLVDPPIPIVVIASTGWYIRGDLGYNFNKPGTPEYSTLWGGTVPFDSSSTGDSWGLGLGIGYQVTENFRVDLTGDYMGDASFKGGTVGYCDPAAQAAGILNCSSLESSKYSAFKLLGNAYADFGNYSGFTPYVGAGLGGANVKWKSLNSATTCVGTLPIPCPAPPFAGPAGSTISSSVGGGDSWRFAWALHTGFSYDITENTKFDLGYTYSDIGGGPMFQWAGVGGTQGYDDGFGSHTIRAGLRYHFY
jgi:opacity protein-like surface antigen